MAANPVTLDIYEKGKQYTCGACGALMTDVVPRHLRCSNGSCERAKIVVMRPGVITAPVNPQLSEFEGQQ